MAKRDKNGQYVYPHIPRDLYPAVVYACKEWRIGGDFYEAAENASERFGVDAAKIAKHMKKRHAAGIYYAAAALPDHKMTKAAKRKMQTFEDIDTLDKMYGEFMSARTDLNEKIEAVRESIIECMERYGLKAYSSANAYYLYKPGNTTSRFQVTKFKQDYPELYEMYRENVRAASLYAYFNKNEKEDGEDRTISEIGRDRCG